MLLEKRVDNEELNSQFMNKTDEEIVVEARNGDNRALEYLLCKYQNFVKAKAKSYFFNWCR